MKHKGTRRVWSVMSNMAARGERLTYRAIAAQVGIVPSTVEHHLNKLSDLGYISRGPKRSGGTLRVTVPVITASGPLS